MAIVNDLTGWKSGRLTVIGRVANNADGRAQWVCRCECGGAHIVRGDYLRAGRVTHCLECALTRVERDRVRIEVWYHLQLLGFDVTGQPGFVDANAGFAVAYQGEREMARTGWIVQRTTRTMPRPVVVQAIRHFASADVIRCGLEPVSVNGWIRRHGADIVHHVFNEGQRVWTEWHARTGEWRGPVEDDETLGTELASLR